MLSRVVRLATVGREMSRLSIEPVILRRQPTDPLLGPGLFVLSGLMALAACGYLIFSPPGNDAPLHPLLFTGGAGLAGLAMLALGLLMLSHVPTSAVVRPDGIDIRTPLRTLRFAFTDFKSIQFMEFGANSQRNQHPTS